MHHYHTNSGRRSGSSSRLILFFILLTLVLGSVLLYKLSRPQTYRPDTPREGAARRVTHVYDGDTLELNNNVKVRLIGVDAPDAHNMERMQEQAHHLGMSPNSVRKWARKATSWLDTMVNGEKVTLTYGPEKKDDYGRLLAYIACQQNASTVEINRQLIERGLATATRIFPHPRLETFIRCEREARRKNRGLWQNATQTYE